MSTMRRIEGMQVAPHLAEFIESKALPGTGVSAAAFWAGLSGLVNGMGGENRALLAKRAELTTRADNLFSCTISKRSNWAGSLITDMV